MDTYNIELARLCLGKAVEDLRNAEQYLLASKLPKAAKGITRIINTVDNRNRELITLLVR